MTTDNLYWERRRRNDARRYEKRYFVYFLLDEHGEVVYIGRSCNVANRIRTHASEARHPNAEENWGYRKSWIFECRSVRMVGPFDWEDAVAREAHEIARHQPRGNRSGTVRDHRPAIAQRSKSIAEAANTS